MVLIRPLQLVMPTAIFMARMLVIPILILAISCWTVQSLTLIFLMQLLAVITMFITSMQVGSRLLSPRPLQKFLLQWFSHHLVRILTTRVMLMNLSMSSSSFNYQQMKAASSQFLLFLENVLGSLMTLMFPISRKVDRNQSSDGGVVEDDFVPTSLPLTPSPSLPLHSSPASTLMKAEMRRMVVVIIRNRLWPTTTNTLTYP